MSPKPSLLAPLIKLVRLDFRQESAANAWQRIFTFFGEYLHLGRARATRAGLGGPAGTGP